MKITPSSCHARRGHIGPSRPRELYPLYAPGFRDQENTSPVIRDRVRVRSVFWITGAMRGTASTCRRRIFSLSARSMDRSSAISAPETKVEARPLEPMRPVRPTRWMKSSGICGGRTRKTNPQLNLIIPLRLRLSRLVRPTWPSASPLRRPSQPPPPFGCGLRPQRGRRVCDPAEGRRAKCAARAGFFAAGSQSSLRTLY